MTVTDEMRQLYSDLFKDCYGFRPRVTPTDDMVIDLWENSDAMLEANSRAEEAALAELARRHDVPFGTWTAYYDWLDAKDAAAWHQARAEREAMLAERQALSTPGHPMVAIDAWEHGEM